MARILQGKIDAPSDCGEQNWLEHGYSGPCKLCYIEAARLHRLEALAGTNRASDQFQRLAKGIALAISDAGYKPISGGLYYETGWPRPRAPLVHPKRRHDRRLDRLT
jgi:hypothetical protein